MGFVVKFTDRSFSGEFPTRQEAADFAMDENDPQAMILDHGYYQGTAAELASPRPVSNYSQGY